MPRLSQKVPRYCKHGRYACCYVNGREVSLGHYKSPESYKAYNKIIAEWCEANGRPDLVRIEVERVEELRDDAKESIASAPAPTATSSTKATNATTIGEVRLKYIQHAKTYHRKNGRITSEVHGIRLALRFLKPFSREPAVDFGPRKLSRVRDAMIKAELKRTTINQCVHRIRRMFRWAEAEEKIPATVLAALKALDGLKADRSNAVEPEPVEAVPDSVVAQTLPHLPIVVQHMVELQRLTGMRPGEVCSLRPCDIDRSGDVWKYTPQEHKTEHLRKRRTIFIGPKAQKILKRYLLRAGGSYCFSPIESEAKRLEEVHEQRKTSENVGNTRGKNRKKKPKRKPGNHYTSASYRRCINRTIEDINIERASEQDKEKRLPSERRHTIAV